MGKLISATVARCRSWPLGPPWALGLLGSWALGLLGSCVAPGSPASPETCCQSSVSPNELRTPSWRQRSFERKALRSSTVFGEPIPGHAGAAALCTLCKGLDAAQHVGSTDCTAHDSGIGRFSAFSGRLVPKPRASSQRRASLQLRAKVSKVCGRLLKSQVSRNDFPQGAHCNGAEIRGGTACNMIHVRCFFLGCRRPIKPNTMTQWGMTTKSKAWPASKHIQAHPSTSKHIQAHPSTSKHIQAHHAAHLQTLRWADGKRCVSNRAGGMVVGRCSKRAKPKVGVRRSQLKTKQSSVNKAVNLNKAVKCKQSG